MVKRIQRPLIVALFLISLMTTWVCISYCRAKPTAAEQTEERHAPTAAPEQPTDEVPDTGTADSDEELPYESSTLSPQQFFLMKQFTSYTQEINDVMDGIRGTATANTAAPMLHLLADKLREITPPAEVARAVLPGAEDVQTAVVAFLQADRKFQQNCARIGANSYFNSAPMRNAAFALEEAREQFFAEKIRDAGTRDDIPVPDDNAQDSDADEDET